MKKNTCCSFHNRYPWWRVGCKKRERAGGGGGVGGGQKSAESLLWINDVSFGSLNEDLI